MKPLEFIRKLLPTFGKKDVREKLRLALSKLADVVGPALENLIATFPAGVFVSQYGKDFNASFLKYVPQRIRNQQSALFSTIALAKENALKLGELLTDHSAKVLRDSIHVEGITYQTVTLLRLIEILDFFGDYTSRFMLRLVTAETNVGVFHSAEKGELSKAEIEYLDMNRTQYFRILELLYEDPRSIMAKLQSIPDLLVATGDAPVPIPALMGGAGDPLELGVVPLLSDLFTAISIRSVNKDIEKYERAKKERRACEMRLEAYRQAGQGGADARTQSIIEGYERELILVRAKIANMGMGDRA
jgi:hypothetical protein